MIKKISPSLLKALTLVAFVFSINLDLHAQSTLTIGDAAPPLKYSKWLKGTPVSSWTDDKLYVVEFWATWCGPCIAAMPHLSELAEKYKNEAVFIGANVLEKVGEKPYESSLPAVERFVNSSVNRMKYNVITDNNAQELNNLWLKPAGIAGIPTTFVISKGKLVWIGHPIKLDTVMEQLLNGKFDMAAHKKEHEISAAKDGKMVKEITDGFASIKAAVDQKDFNKAFSLIDELGVKQPILKLSLNIERFKILLNHFEESRAMEYAAQLLKEGNAYSTMLAVTISEKDGLSKKPYLLAAEILEKELAKRTYSALYNMLATAYSKEVIYMLPSRRSSMPWKQQGRK